MHCPWQINGQSLQEMGPERFCLTVFFFEHTGSEKGFLTCTLEGNASCRVQCVCYTRHTCVSALWCHRRLSNIVSHSQQGTINVSSVRSHGGSPSSTPHASAVTTTAFRCSQAFVNVVSHISPLVWSQRGRLTPHASLLTPAHSFYCSAQCGESMPASFPTVLISVWSSRKFACIQSDSHWILDILVASCSRISTGSRLCGHWGIEVESNTIATSEWPCAILISLSSTIDLCNLTSTDSLHQPTEHVAQETERLSGNWKVAGFIPDSPEQSVEVSLSNTPHLNCSLRAGCCLAWLEPPSVYECVYEWVNMRQYCKALWIKALYKMLSIYQWNLELCSKKTLLLLLQRPVDIWFFAYWHFFISLHILYVYVTIKVLEILKSINTL